MAKIASEKDGEHSDGLLLSNPNAYDVGVGGDSPALPKHTFTATANKERSSTRSKNRSKRPFFKKLVGGLRKLSNQDSDELDGEGVGAVAGSLSDNDEPATPQSPAIDKYSPSERQQIDHFATLPRKHSEWRKNSMDKATLIKDHHRQTSLDDSRGASAACDYAPEYLETHSPDERESTMSPVFTDTHVEYRLAGMDALEMLHNQLQILVQQDGDEDMADVMPENVTESCQAQIIELQKSIDNLQKSDHELRLSVRLAELRAQESELKLHHCKEHYHKMEHNYKGLEKEYKRLYKKHKELEKYLQKKAVLNQISTEQNMRDKSNSLSFERLSPSKMKRPNSAQQPRKHRVSESAVSPSHSYTVKRYNSSEHIPRNHQLQSANTTGTLPRKGGSMSHTETRV